MSGKPHASEPALRLRQARHDLAIAEDCGYFGPHSIIWKVNREAVLGLGLGHALLLQLAHPFVAEAVAQHSSFPGEAETRLAATWLAATYLVFGSRAQADRVASRIRGIHGRVNGELTEDVGRWPRGARYSAEDREALLWVLATLAETSLAVFERFVRPLSVAEQAEYVADAERLGAMVDAPPGRLPRSLPDLRHYVAVRLADRTLQVGSHALPLAGACLDPPSSDLPVPVRKLYRSLERTVCHMLLPAELREQYQPILGPRPRVSDRALEAVVRAMVPRLPLRLRCDPLAWTAVSRWQQNNTDPRS